MASHLVVEPRPAESRRLLGFTSLPPSRRRVGVLLVVVALPLLTLVLVRARDQLSLATVLLLYLMTVVVIAVVGGPLPAGLAAIASFGLANWFLTPPYHTFEVEHRDNVISLLVFVFVAAVVSIAVDIGARHRVTASRNRAEAEALSRFVAAPVDESSLSAVLSQVRDLFGMTSVALLRRDGGQVEDVGRVGPPLEEPPAMTVDLGPNLSLVATGPRLFAEDRQLLARLADTAARAWEGQLLAEQAAKTQQLAEIDRVRSALLAAVGHDLRTPLAGVKAAVSSLRQEDVTWTLDEQQQLLATIETSADRLDALISNLLAMSRLQAGALLVKTEPVALDAVVAQVVLNTHEGHVSVDVPDHLPRVSADPGLLERVVANLVDNALRVTPAGQSVHVSAQVNHDSSVTLSIIDAGPGVPEHEWDQMFAPFQRLGDRATHVGVGLGLAIARGFTEAMHGDLTPSRTAGGGLTMAITLPQAS
ncbi:MAG: DUF4118 domain-containing protein [Propionibacteriales bacterium]|nr:DUF4118 domain-containing protein [Propionibacteriales bacterium]